MSGKEPLNVPKMAAVLQQTWFVGPPIPNFTTEDIGLSH
jgi:hypothetical protein